MKLHSHIARYIRRCGYAVALTLAAGTLQAATNETFIEYLSYDGVTTEHLDRAAEYKLDVDARMPEVPAETPVWNTVSILEAYAESSTANDGTGTADVLSWVPWRPKQGYSNYHFFLPDATSTEPDPKSERFHDTIMKVSGAVRPSVQNGVDANTGKPITDAEGNELAPLLVLSGADGERSAVQGISYIGALSVHAWKDDPWCTANNKWATGLKYANGADSWSTPATTSTPINLYNNQLIINNSGFALAVGAYSQYGDVTNNSVYIRDVRASDDMYGAMTWRGNACNNSITIVRAQSIGGKYKGENMSTVPYTAAFNNGGRVVGAYIRSASAEASNRADNNSVFLYGSDLFLELIGAVGPNANENTVFVSRSTLARCAQINGAYIILSPILGGSASKGTANGNTVIVDDTYDEDHYIPEEIVDNDQAAGGWTSTLQPVSNILCGITAGETEGLLEGAGANDNTVIVIGKTVEGATTNIQGDIIGGLVNNSSTDTALKDSGDASGNLIYIEGADIRRTSENYATNGSDFLTYNEEMLKVGKGGRGSIYGGYIKAAEDGRIAGDTSENKIILRNSSIANNVYGGFNAMSGEASNNQVHIEDIDTKGAALTFYGGWLDSYARGGHTNNNNVYLYGKDSDISNTFLHGGWGNQVYDFGSVTNADSFDGTYFYDELDKVAKYEGSNFFALDQGGNVDLPLFSADTVIAVFNGTHFYSPDGSELAEIDSDGILRNSKNIAMPGYVFKRYVINADGSVTFYNKDDEPIAILTTSKIVALDANGAETETICKIDNHVDTATGIVSPGKVSEVSTLISGCDEYDTFTRNNWLHLVGYQGKLRGFDHFEGLKFTFTDEIDLTKPMITLTGPQEETGLTYTDENGTVQPVDVEVDIAAIADQLQPGDIIPVIGEENHEEIVGMDKIDNVVDDNRKYRRGVTRTVQLETDFKEMDGGDFDNFGVIEILGREDSVTPEAKALIEGRIATLTLNIMAGDLVAGQAVDAACRAAEQAAPVAADPTGKDTCVYVVDGRREEIAPGRRLFYVMSGGHNRVDSGSHVNVDGVNALLGIASDVSKERALTLGAFVETGWGQYTTHSTFDTLPQVRGTGETSYVGGGALMRYRMDSLTKRLKGFVLDASVRAGRQTTDFGSMDLMDDYGTFAEYELDSAYIAGHVGVNYTWNPTDRLSAMVYARYQWTHFDNDDADVCSERVTFEDMDSNRLSLGTRMSWQANENWTPYAGLAYQWECSGTARAVTHGMGITAPSMRGSSFVGEIGTVWQPNVAKPLWFDFGVQGSTGKVTGGTGKFGVTIGF